MEKLKFRIAMYGLREERDIKPASFGKLVSSLLYEKRFGPYFIEVCETMLLLDT
jgi:20S proteasome subunit beta 3